MRHQATWSTTSADETLAVGEALGRSLAGGLTVGLVGALGTGKTQLVKGIASGNAIDDVCRVTSPTFTLVHEYPGRLALFHLDAYRLKGVADLLSLGFDELVGPDSAVVIEWADRVKAIVPEDVLWIVLTATGTSCRRLVFTATGALPVRCLTALKQALR